MDPIFDLIDGLQVAFEGVIEWLTHDGLQVTDVSSGPIDGGAAATHARMVPQFPLLQIRVSQCVLTRDPLVLQPQLDRSDGTRRGLLTGSKTSICVRR